MLKYKIVNKKYYSPAEVAASVDKATKANFPNSLESDSTLYFPPINIAILNYYII